MNRYNYLILVLTAVFGFSFACSKSKKSSKDEPVQQEQQDSQNDEDLQNDGDEIADDYSDPTQNDDIAVKKPNETEDKDVVATGACISEATDGCNFYRFYGKASKIQKVVNTFKDSCIHGRWAKTCDAPLGACYTGKHDYWDAKVEIFIVTATHSIRDMKDTCAIIGAQYRSTLN